MAKRSSSGRVYKSSNVEKESESTGKSSPKTVRLVCVLGLGKKITNGPVTGKKYVFNKNLPTEVDEEDVNEMLAIKRGGCCGNLPTHIFVKAE